MNKHFFSGVFMLSVGLLLLLFLIPLGIDTPKKEELIANNLTVKEISNRLKLDSLYFLSIKGLYKAMGFEDRDNSNPQFTDHCFTGDYPTELVDLKEGILSTQLSLLSDNY